MSATPGDSLAYPEPRIHDYGDEGNIHKLVSLGHPECDVPACHMLSLMWGSGRPALYHHEKLDEITHRRGHDLHTHTRLGEAHRGREADHSRPDHDRVAGQDRAPSSRRMRRRPLRSTRTIHS